MSKKFISSNMLGTISTIINNPGEIRIAVPYWTRSVAADIDLTSKIAPKLSRRVTVLCDLFNPTTDPNAISDLMEAGHRVMFSERLHAKVIICKNAALVGSANMTVKGLSDTKFSNWEAGILVQNDPIFLKDCNSWFDGLVQQSVDVTLEDIAKAIAMRKKRDPSQINSFASRITAQVGSANLSTSFILVCTCDLSPETRKVEKGKIQEETRKNNVGAEIIRENFVTYSYFKNMPERCLAVGCYYNDESESYEFHSPATMLWAKKDSKKVPVNMGYFSKDRNGLTNLLQSEAVKSGAFLNLLNDAREHNSGRRRGKLIPFSELLAL